MSVDFQNVELRDKVAIVTGAGNGIGRAEALSLAASGACVVVNDVGLAAAAGVVGEIEAAGGRAVAAAGDVSEWKVTGDLVAEAVRSFGRLDIVVSNAGIVRRSPIAAVTEKDLDDQVAVLFKGTFGLIRHAAAYWQGEHAAGNRSHRTIVATSSSAGVPGGVQEFSVYGAMKAGIAALALGAALEFRDFGVTVNAILPHAATAMDAAAKGLPDPGAFGSADPSPENPHHVANVVRYLASERAAWLSGQVFEITGTVIRRWLPWSPGAEASSAAPWTSAVLDVAMATEIYGTLPGGRVIPIKR
jgi:NAD(P)-dependent dehydrogenase (short-subunit alcohol dehydrogenase family)